MNQFDWPITQKIETMEAPQNRRFYGKMECLLFRPIYISDRVVKTNVTWPSVTFIRIDAQKVFIIPMFFGQQK
jgi:hypothetical protein